ncbi:MAG: glycosyl hydrolase family 18 protein [Planctomycetota bacterium]
MTTNYLTTVYINPRDVAAVKDIASWRRADGTAAVRFVCIFAANYASATSPFLRAENNQPPTADQFNPNIQSVLDSDAVAYLQSQGIKVLLTITNGWSDVGWSQFRTEASATAFVDYLIELVEHYGLDGIDIDDEYSQGQPITNSLAMVTTLMRRKSPSMLITKVLAADQSYFGVAWNGCTLEQNLDYGWQMNYGEPAQCALPPYVQAGMLAPRVAMGYWNQQLPPSWSDDVRWIMAHQYGGCMVFGFEDEANVNLMGKLVDELYGPGNWTRSARD